MGDKCHAFRYLTRWLTAVSRTGRSIVRNAPHENQHMRVMVTIALVAAGAGSGPAALPAQNVAPPVSRLSGPAKAVSDGPMPGSNRVSAGNYRITVAGFRVNHNTYDDPLNRDGWGDEVYASVVLQRFNRSNGSVLETRTVTSRAHGDGKAARERVPQGHASDAGGLRAGDVVPFGWDERAVKPPTEKGRFPLVVWEGPLADSGDVLVLRPALWELDGDRASFDFWTRSLTASAPAATWGLAGVQQSLTTSAIAPVEGPTLELSVESGRDRPIGLRDRKWYDQVLVLNREKIEGALRLGDRPGNAPGLIVLRLQEAIGTGHPAENGDYVLYLRVERQ